MLLFYPSGSFICYLLLFHWLQPPCCLKPPLYSLYPAISLLMVSSNPTPAITPLYIPYFFSYFKFTSEDMDLRASDDWKQETFAIWSTLWLMKFVNSGRNFQKKKILQFLETTEMLMTIHDKWDDSQSKPPHSIDLNIIVNMNSFQQFSHFNCIQFMSLFYVAISMRGEWKKQYENEKNMQKKRILAKYRICGFHFAHDLYSIILSNALSYVLLHCTIPVSLWIETNNLLLFLF